MPMQLLTADPTVANSANIVLYYGVSTVFNPPITISGPAVVWGVVNTGTTNIDTNHSWGYYRITE
jgi:hypothetical protein